MTAGIAADFNIRAGTNNGPEISPAGVGLSGHNHIAQVDLLRHSSYLPPRFIKLPEQYNPKEEKWQ